MSVAGLLHASRAIEICAALFPSRTRAFFAERLDDDFRRRAGRQSADVFKMNPAASRDFVASASFGPLRDIAEKNVMVFLRTAILEEIFRRLAREARLLLEFPQRGLRQMFTVLEDSTRQRPFRLTSCDQQNALASSTDNSGSFPQVRSGVLSLYDLKCWGAQVVLRSVPNANFDGGEKSASVASFPRR